MHNQRIRILSAVLTLAASSIVAVAFASPASAAVPGQIVITEWMYNPVADALRVRRDHEHRRRSGPDGDLLVRRRQSRGRNGVAGGLGTLAPGESALIVENPEPRRSAPSGPSIRRVKIRPGNTANLGRNDEINIFNGDTLADRLTYGDQTFRRHDPHPRDVGRSDDVPRARRQQRRPLAALGGWRWARVDGLGGAATSVRREPRRSANADL